MTHKVTLTAATAKHDHTRDLTSGDIEIEGADITWLQLPPEEIFYRFLLHREWDISELSMAKYASLRAQDDNSFTAIPVFLSRVFRHSSIYVRADSDLRDPRMLAGRRVGIPEWAQTAAVYTRGLLAEDYGVNLTSIEWIQAGVNQTGRHEKVHMDRPQGVRCRTVENRSLNDMLLAGEVDAIMTARPPAAFGYGDEIIRLFPDAAHEERQYFQRTGVFPIMHIVAIKKEVVDRYPWIPMSLFKGFAQARDNSVARIRDAAVSAVPVPWATEFAFGAPGPFGEDPWPYGIDSNSKTLEKFLEYAYEQGVCKRRLSPRELFAPQVDVGFRV